MEREREEGEKERNAQILYRIPKGQTLPDLVQGGENMKKYHNFNKLSMKFIDKTAMVLS